MNIAILGANGATGKLVLEQALAAGHTVSALVRRPDDVLASQPGVKVTVGDATVTEDVAKAVSGTDAIISTLGGMQDDLMTNAMSAVVAASKTTGVKRLILMSSFAVRSHQLSGETQQAVQSSMGKMVADKEASEELVRASDLDWTIVYPTIVTDGEGGQTVREVDGAELVGFHNTIDRADVATWMLNEAENSQYVHKGVVITA
jgi:uncharacterized protein YbjT (DUF2867 family)